MARLTKAEERLLRYPPTELTWLCRGCGIACAGSATRCWACGASKPRKPELVWPEYLRVCAKAGVDLE